MSWKLQGSYFETCSCNVVCPCTASFALGISYEGNAACSRSESS